MDTVIRSGDRVHLVNEGFRVPVGEAGVEQADGGLRFAFTLPPGAYATVLMEEIGKEGLRLSGGEPESGADG